MSGGRAGITIVLGALLLACPSDPSDDASTAEGAETTASTGTATSVAGSGTTDAGSTTGPTDSSPGTTGADTGSGSEASTTGDPGTTGGSSSGGSAALGTIDGECGLVDAKELSSSSPFTFENSIDFRGLGFDYDALTPGSQAVFDAGNLGGSSLHSETIAFEVLARCEGASLLATEGEIAYVDDMGTKTDILVELDGLAVGVSVTRAVGFPPEDPYTQEQATELLVDKLGDVLDSTANVAPRDAWIKQILHVIAYADMHAQSIFDAYAELPPELVADTILVVTVTHGNDEFVY